MTCNVCGELLDPKSIPEPKAEGSFLEVYECPNGHKGVVSGREEEPASQWDHWGEAYE